MLKIYSIAMNYISIGLFDLTVFFYKYRKMVKLCILRLNKRLSIIVSNRVEGKLEDLHYQNKSTHYALVRYKGPYD